MKRRALVTGGSGAIGAAICRRLAADGCEVIVHANGRLDAAEAVAREIGGRAVAFDVTDGAATRSALEALVEEAPIQVLVNSAGIHDDAPFPGMSEAQWHRVLDVSLNGFFHVTQPLVMPMARTRGGGAVGEHDVVTVGGEPAADRGADAAAAAGHHGQRAGHYSAAASSSRTVPGTRPVSRSTTSVWALSAPVRVAAPKVA